MGEGVSPAADSLAPCLPGTMFFPFSVTPWHSGKGQVAAQGVGYVGTPRLQVRAVLLSQQSCSIAIAVLSSSHVESRACGWKTQYPTDLFLLPELLQAISHDERENMEIIFISLSASAGKS